MFSPLYFIKASNRYDYWLIYFRTRIATHSNLDFRKIGYYLDRIAKIRWRLIATNKGSPSKVYLERYKEYKKKKSYIDGKIIYPMSCCKTRNAMNFSAKVNKYTKEGREIIHEKVVDIHRLIYATKSDTIHELLVKLDLSTKQINQVNQFRLKVGNIVI